MKIYTVTKTQILPVTLTAAWEFFSNPMNLSKITPGSLFCSIQVDGNRESIYPGTIISYNIKPLFGIPVTWVTEITHIIEKELFVDEQRFGPYRFWHHKHFFREVENGTEITDVVHYIMPMGWLGRLVHFLVVRQKLQEIFTFRTQVLSQLFVGKYSSGYEKQT
ncbi:MAG: SRPBCC family protein [Ignavibacteria bacterium]|nr:SRPBCC family protein [Ignavibacteria bacterium]